MDGKVAHDTWMAEQQLQIEDMVVHEIDSTIDGIT
jgi:hypothetical protein